MATAKKPTAEEAPAESAAPEASPSATPETISFAEHRAALTSKDADIASLSRRCAELEADLAEHRAALANLKPTPAKTRKAGRYKVVGPGSVTAHGKSHPAGAVLDLSADEAKSLGAEVEAIEG